jgi:hypothetical protein
MHLTFLNSFDTDAFSRDVMQWEKLSSARADGQNATKPKPRNEQRETIIFRAPENICT